MILILNCFVNNKLSETFNNVILRITSKIDSECEFFRITQKQSIIDLGKYSHIIISGSEASINDKNKWDEYLANLILDSVKLNKHILGICYGHQFIAKTLVGDNCVGKAKIPELGWLKINLSDNKIFKNIDKPLFMVSHYDEVKYLDDNFITIANSQNCAIHGFQHKVHPIWGVQFHPEYMISEADEIFEFLSNIDENFEKHFTKQNIDIKHITQNEKVILNFLHL